MSDGPFVECLGAFAAHDYERAANLGVNLLQSRRYHWLYQVIIISLQRQAHDEAALQFGQVALDSFSEHAWQTDLLRLTLEGRDVDAGPEGDPVAACQRDFYRASSWLTRGQRAKARPLFEAAAATQAPCAEAGLARDEVAAPEPRVMTLYRVLLKCQNAREDAQADPDTFFRDAETAVEILEERPAAAESPEERQELHRLAAGLGAWLQHDHVFGQARVLRDRLAELDPGDGGAPAVPRRKPVGPPPLRPTQVLLSQLVTSDLPDLSKAAIGFGFPLFLGRPEVMASPEGPLHQMMRDQFQDGQEGSPFCRRRFSGDSSAPLPRARYHAVCDAGTASDGGTLVAEMTGYNAPNLTGYCAARAAAGGIELVFRGLPGEPNPFHLACRSPDAFEHVFRGLPSGHVTRAVQELPDADTELVIAVPASSTAQRFERCFDLRQPQAREWLLHLFTNPPDGLHGDALRVLARLHQFDLGQVQRWVDLLPVLIARTMGGNTLTDMVGAYLRHLGCDALIFPSARHDFHAYFEDGELVSASGWNLVDYRGLDATDRVGIDVGNPIEPLSGHVVCEEATEGPGRGSIRLVGNTMTSRVTSQLLYEDFLRVHGSKWRLEHRQPDLFVRGYFWYRRRYALTDPTFLGICDRCGHSTTDEREQVLPACPACGFAGD